MREHWSSRLGFILAALGSAIGLGTLWKFPYVTSEYGGGLFVLLYLLFTLFLGIPLFIGELLLGRDGQRGAVGIFTKFAGESTSWRIIGWLGVSASLLILSFYCVVAGWGLNYLLLSLNQFYETHNTSDISHIFGVLYTSGDINLFWAFIFLLMTCGVVFQGVRKGIELWSRILMIGLLCMLVGLCIYACTLDGFGKALSFLFTPKLSDLQVSGILEALGLSLFTLSLAQGIILTYGSYLGANANLPKLALIVGSSVIVISMLTIMTIFPVIFTFDLKVEEGAGLIFETLPVLFASLPGSMVLSTVFFSLFVFAALTSAIALLEVVTANLVDLFPLSRKQAVLISSSSVFVVGIPSALAGGGHFFKDWKFMYGVNFFGTIDKLVSAWILPIGAFLTAVYIGWRLKREFVREEFCKGTSLGAFFSIWFFLVRWVVPVAIIFIIVYQSGFIG